MSNVIQFSDDVLIEISGTAGRAEPINSAQVSNVNREFSKVVGAIQNFVAPVANSVAAALAQTTVESAEVVLGFSFTAEGNLVICKASAEGSVKVTLTVNRGAQQ
ncbi:CU044_2847 family protein [Prosthecodimorpha staleyi]|uniref:Trypsin-co-occurring domain-containing protein n=1 Tax=Prosthecodimorpha staleyi TaxID=2840188 RepID=A0A947GF81_9HYPH|nr:CU044_2847 family protein [Prosthecodimorpha staleyi]MBT9290255.1 hypothetical protein [Prosthecodimorpha staleyi]